MPGVMSGYRGKLFGAVHAEAVKRHMDHDALHAMCKERFAVNSMSKLRDDQLLSIYKDWTGKTLKSKAKLPRRGTREADRLQLVSAEELLDLAQQFALLEWDTERQSGFIQRQLQGRDEVRTRGDYAAVVGGLRAMKRRQAEWAT